MGFPFRPPKASTPSGVIGRIYPALPSMSRCYTIPLETVAVEGFTARLTGCGRPYAARERGPAFKKTSREALPQTDESCLVRNRRRGPTARGAREARL